MYIAQKSPLFNSRTTAKCGSVVGSGIGGEKSEPQGATMTRSYRSVFVGMCRGCVAEKKSNVALPGYFFTAVGAGNVSPPQTLHIESRSPFCAPHVAGTRLSAYDSESTMSGPVWIGNEKALGAIDFFSTVDVR